MELYDAVFSPSDITAENLAALRARESVCEETRVAELSFLADSAAECVTELISNGMDCDTALSLIADGLFLLEADETSTDGEHRLFYERMSEFDKASFAGLCLERLAERGITPKETDFLPSVRLPETFTYVKNAYADEAYEVFSSDFSDPRVGYSPSFKHAVKRVLDGEVGYCLLPLEERGGVRLAAVTELLSDNDLKINAVTPVFGFSGEAELRYALVSRTFRVPPPAAGDDRYLEIRFSETDGRMLSGLLCAARRYGASLYRIHTATRRERGEACSFYTVVLRTEEKSFLPLLVYLTLFVPTYTPVGLYTDLE